MVALAGCASGGGDTKLGYSREVRQKITVPPDLVPPEALDVPPKKLTDTYPTLPVQWLERSPHARVVAFLVVDANGKVVDAQIAYATEPRWGALVLKTVRRWRFDPGFLDGKPVPTYVQVPFEFHLKR